LQLALLAAGVVLGSAGVTLLAGLAKESAGVVLVSEVLRRGRRRDWAGTLRYGLAAAGLAGWSAFVLLAVRGARESTLGGHLLDPPGAPFLTLAQSLTGNPGLFVLTLPAVTICVLTVVRLIRARDAAAWGAAAYALLALAAGSDTWRSAEASYRVMAGAYLLLFLSWCVRGDRMGMYPLLLGAATVALAPFLLLR
jgi:uncharacterized membrane protein